MTSISLTVQAEIIDIRADSPKQRDIFFVDTNVWIWQTYSKFSIAKPESRMTSAELRKKRRWDRKRTEYGHYLRSSLIQEATLTYSALTLPELAHHIERTELDIYRLANGRTQPKVFRHNLPIERSMVVAEVEAAWEQVKDFAICAPVTVNEELADAAFLRYSTQALDGYDLMMLEAIARAGTEQIQVITDDCDYAVVPNIQVFTSNQEVIQAASTQGQLVTR